MAAQTAVIGDDHLAVNHVIEHDVEVAPQLDVDDHLEEEVPAFGLNSSTLNELLLPLSQRV